MGTAQQRYPSCRPAAWVLAGGDAPLSVHVAAGFGERFLGLMGAGVVEEGFGLLFERCTSIHMFFMRVPIDLVWLGPVLPDGARAIVSVERGLRPWRVALAPKGTVAALEVRAGTAPADAAAVRIGGR